MNMTYVLLKLIILDICFDILLLPAIVLALIQIIPCGHIIEVKKYMIKSDFNVTKSKKGETYLK